MTGFADLQTDEIHRTRKLLLPSGSTAPRGREKGTLLQVDGHTMNGPIRLKHSTRPGKTALGVWICRVR